ncbi:hypothetical protein [Nioella nitratireducens]|uniref:hypothetical protein n=1 Tax=Nioella nitratireducens TaxID=1287720 RepID=UPI0008FD32BD|nr:hypothetical protein [Nioella nitratireducens]
MNGKARIGVFLNGLPDFEALFALLRVLAARGRVDVNVFATTALARKEPRALPLLRGAGMVPVVRPNRWLKHLYRPYLKRFDILLGLSDPATDETAHGKRTAAISRAGKPCVSVQHGVIQRDWTYSDSGGPLPWDSALVLLYEPPDPSVFGPAIGKAASVGFLKPAVLDPRPLPPGVAPAVAAYRQRLLFCHSFRWQDRFSQEQIRTCYDLIEGFARANPDVLTILRSHRGKKRAPMAELDRRLAACPNVVLSHQGSGPLRGMTMTDILAVSDLMVSTPSTALLDGVYAGRPAAVFANDSDKFTGLPQITDPASLQAFSDAPHSSAASCDALRNRFGDIASNLDNAAEEIEAFAAQVRSGKA